MKKSFALLLSLLMLVLLLPWNLHVASAETSGQCGNNAFWSFSENTGTLTISGTGAMWDYKAYNAMPWYPYIDKINTVVVADGITATGYLAFHQHYNLQSVELPATLKELNGFSYCTSLKSISIPYGVELIKHEAFKNAGIQSIVLPESVTKIENYAFAYSAIQSIDMPSNITSIGHSVFLGCEELKRIELPQGITTIPDSTFAGCNNLECVVLPSTLTEIELQAFAACTSLKNIIIPEGVASIGAHVFYNCTSLAFVCFPISLQYIETTAFRDCSSLVDVYYAGTKEQRDEIYIGQAENDCLLGAHWHYNSTGPEGNGDYYDLQYGKYKYTYDSNYFQRPSYSPDNALAMFAGILSMAVYHDDGKSTIREVYSDLEIPEEDYYDNSYDRDKDLRFSIAVKKIHIDGEEYVLLMLSMRGTVHIWSEGIWRDHFANADVDLAFAPYKAYDCIDEFRRNVMSQLYLFVETHPEIMTSKLKVLITGHSLGGAAANLIGAQFNSFILNGGFYNLKERNDIFVYTFGAIDSIDTPVSINAGYENIHNITNYYDNFGPNGWAPVASAAGNTRYGKFGNIDIFYEDKDNGAFGIEHQMNHSMYETYLEAVYNGNVRYHREGQDYYVCCPVDVRVYDGETLVCEVVNETINRDTTSIPVIVYEQRKVFHLPDDKEYRIEISARDAGSMIYQIKDIATGVSEKRYADVALTENKQFASIVGGDIEAEDVTLYVVNEDGEPIGEVHEDGTETPIVLLGDADGDHVVTAADAALILRYLVKLDALSEFQRSCADVNGDGVIDATDASKLLRRLVGLEK